MVNASELQVIESTFKLLDTRGVGRIRKEYAMKIITMMGIKNKDIKLPTELTLPEVVSTIEFLTPKHESTLQNQLEAFHHLMDVNYHPDMSHVSPDALSKMLGPAGASKDNVLLLLRSMMDWDDCSEDPVIKCSKFNEVVTKFAGSMQGKQNLAHRRNSTTRRSVKF